MYTPFIPLFRVFGLIGKNVERKEKEKGKKSAKRFPLFVLPRSHASEEEEEEESRRLDGEENLAVRVASAERARAGIDATARSADRIGRGALDVAFAGGL